MSDTVLPEPDRIEGAPHPRETYVMLGQERAEAEFLAAAKGGKLHHGWMITGPRGVGKATLAWRMARFLLANPTGSEPAGLFGDAPPLPDTLESDPDTSLNRRIEALSEPGLMLIRRGATDDGKRLKSQITVDEVRKLGSFFGLSSSDGGNRVVIVDCLDEMNPSAANAILKLLEEPPKNAYLLLVCHQPTRVLPTIRSRCREVRLRTLDAEEIDRALAAAGNTIEAPEALSEISGGSVGRTLQLLNAGGLDLYADILGILGTAPRLDRARVAKLADGLAARGAEARLGMAVDLIDLVLSRVARSGAGLSPKAEIVPGERETLLRLAPSQKAAQDWAVLQQSLRARIDHGLGVNVAPAALITDAFLKINEIAARS